MNKSPSMWRFREVSTIDHSQFPLSSLLYAGSVAVRETTTPLKDRTINSYQMGSLIAVCEGRSRYIMSGHEMIVEGPSVIVRPPGGDLRHIGESGSDCRAHYFCICGPLANQLLPLHDHSQPYFLSNQHLDELYEPIIKAVDMAFSSNPEREWSLSESLLGIFRSLTTIIPALVSKESAFIQRMRTAVQDNWSRSYSVDELAQRMGYSRSEFFRRCKEDLGTTPKDWIRSQRMQLAQFYLKDGFNVSEVANYLQFSSPYAFSRAFKAHTGMTPKAFSVSKK